MSNNKLHALSFDVEEYFQVANLRHHFTKADWLKVESRLDVGMQRIFDLLDRTQSSATFFFLGWVAERRPDLVQRCLRAGHEVGSHGYDHDFLGDLGPEGFVRDLERTEQALVAAGAPKPRGFRASTFTLTRDTFWAVDILIERGYQFDSSIHPVRHPTYGIPDFEPGISVLRSSKGDGEIIEFPVTTVRGFGRNWPAGGGGYFRLLPAAWTRRAVQATESAGRPASLYLHPWEFDPEQPRVPAPAFNRFRHYFNLSKTLPRLERLLRSHRFGSLAQVLEAEGYGDRHSA